MSAEVKDEIVRYTGPYPYLDGLILMTTSSITSVEVEHHERQAGTGNYSFAKSIRLWLQMATSFSVLPLRVSGLLGMLLALAGLIFSFVVVTLRLLGDAGVPLGWTSLMTALLVIGGAQLVALSLLGEYLGRTYIRLNNVPQFSIKEALNLSIGSAPGDGGFDGRRQANGR
jgi:undecaprenyl-phosphate 4-deoxy-4-formamido-L-arabinose transferase